MKVASDSSGRKDTTFLAGGEEPFPTLTAEPPKQAPKLKESGQVRAGGREAVSGPRAAGDGVEHGASRDTEEHG